MGNRGSALVLDLLSELDTTLTLLVGENESLPNLDDLDNEAFFDAFPDWQV
jgi:hypothetical protein